MNNMTLEQFEKVLADKYGNLTIRLKNTDGVWRATVLEGDVHIVASENEAFNISSALTGLIDKA